MEFRPYWGDNRLKHKIVYDADGSSDCIYCGKPADSREHIPSKTFIDRPYPPNLYLVPACSQCNNSFSSDELYTWFVLKYLEKQYSGNIKHSVHEEQRYQQHPNILKTVITDINSYIASEHTDNDANSIFSFRSKRIERVLEKLALGHMVFELSEGYYTEATDAWKAEKILYAFLPTLSTDIIYDYDCAVDIKELILPEVGSRVYDHIFPVTIPLAKIENSDSMLVLGSLLLDWTDIQDNKYRYIALFDMNMIQVNIVIDEFLFASVFFSTEFDGDMQERKFDSLGLTSDECQSLRNVACVLVDSKRNPENSKY